MYRYHLALLLAAVLCISLVTPVSTKAQKPPVPLVLIHGQGAGPELTWKQMEEHLQARGYVPGITLFVVDLTGTGGEVRKGGLLTDAAVVAAEIRRIRTLTGTEQVDLVGHSRGGLIARLLASGETGGMVRRAVSIDAPHDGAISPAVLQAMLDAVGVAPDRRDSFAIPSDLVAGSDALRFLQARERAFPDQRAPALAIGSTWQDGLPEVLSGHDGAVPLASQLDWPGALTATFRLGPSAQELPALQTSGWAAMLLLWKSPHMQAPQSEAVVAAIDNFLQAPVLPGWRRGCSPNCAAGAGGAETARAQRELARWLPGHATGLALPDPHRALEVDRPMTRAEFMYELVRSLGLSERLAAPAFPDMAGHWALGYVEAARAAEILSEQPGERFRPNQPVTELQAALWRAGARRYLTGRAPVKVARAEPVTREPERLAA